MTQDGQCTAAEAGSQTAEAECQTTEAERQEDSSLVGAAALSAVAETDARARSLALNDSVPASGLFGEADRPLVEGSRASWRIAPEPFLITPESFHGLQQLGDRLLAFYSAANRLYKRSVRGTIPAFFHEYLDSGKSETVIDYGRMNRFRHDLPGVIRPDLLLTTDGVKAAELDSIPGGIGLTGSMQQHYSSLGFIMVGGANGMVEGFGAMIRSRAANDDPQLAIAVSDESNDYRPEMQWVSDQLCALGMNSACAKPEEIELHGNGLMLEGQPVDTLYRFFELFDLKNIPNYDVLLYAARKQLVTMTPPVKAYLEEKLLFALFHHPVLAEYWVQEMGAQDRCRLEAGHPRDLDTRPASLAAASGRAGTGNRQAAGDELGAAKGIGSSRPAARHQAVRFRADRVGQPRRDHRPRPAGVGVGQCRAVRARRVLDNAPRLTEVSSREPVSNTLLRLCARHGAHNARPGAPEPILLCDRRQNDAGRHPRNRRTGGQEAYPRYGRRRDGPRGH